MFFLLDVSYAIEWIVHGRERGIAFCIIDLHRALASSEVSPASKFKAERSGFLVAILGN